MEYKRYINFVNDENTNRFETYLPIQLDATCNGFQHLALLSNENILFKELNLKVDKGEKYPKDFYTFLLHKLISIFEQKVYELSSLDNIGQEDFNLLNSYKRLLKIVWERNQVKKAIMTITYNATHLAMTSYILDNIHKVDTKNLKASDD